MSEIRSISEGTFVIGDTNGLTFEAGPGISVSQPSEGTVRIANDETVLFETNVSSATTDDVILSESRLNFDHIRIISIDNNNNTFDFIMRSDISSVRGTGSYYSGTSWIGFRVDEIVATNATTLSIPTTPQISINSSGSFRSFGSEKFLKILKVVGINRISGGNNE